MLAVVLIVVGLLLAVNSHGAPAAASSAAIAVQGVVVDDPEVTPSIPTVTAVQPVSVTPDPPQVFRRVAAFAVLIGAGLLRGHVPRGRTPTGAGGRSGIGSWPAMPVPLVGVTPGLLRV